jgi:hypothetical protein
LALLKADAHSNWYNQVSLYGFAAEYDWRWDKCHGIVLATDGSPWLVECSYDSGIIARQLPILNIDFKSSNAHLAAALARFGGIPSGEAFPTYSISESDDTYKVLMSAEDYRDDFIDKFTPYKEWVGWAFSPSNKARICCYESTGAGAWDIAYTWELTITIDPSGSGNYDATLTEISNEKLFTSVNYYGYGGVGVWFYDPFNRRYDAFYPYGGGPSGERPSSWDITIWTAWIDGDWSEARYRAGDFERPTVYGIGVTHPSLIVGGTWYQGTQATGNNVDSHSDPGAAYGKYGASYTTEVDPGQESLTLGELSRLVISNGEYVVSSTFTEGLIFVQAYVQWNADYYTASANTKDTSILVNPYCRESYMVLRTESFAAERHRAYINRNPVRVSNPHSDYDTGETFDIHLNVTLNWEASAAGGNGYPYPAATSESHPYPALPTDHTTRLLTKITDDLSTSKHVYITDPSETEFEVGDIWALGTNGNLAGPNQSTLLTYTDYFPAFGYLDTWSGGYPTGYTHSPYPYQTVASRVSDTTDDGSFTVEGWLVGEYVPNTTIHFPKKTFNDNDYEFGIGFFKSHFWQTATLGTKAAVYTDPTVTVDPAYKYEYILTVEKDGTMPAMPENGDEESHKTVSFVGVNGP